MTWQLAGAAILAAALAAEPAAQPAPDPDMPEAPAPNDPLERLYGRKQLTFRGGEPVVTVRLMEGQRSVTFVPKGRMRLRARGGLEKVLEAPAGTTWTVRLKDYEPGEVSWSVQAAELPWSDRDGLAEARKTWDERGYSARVVAFGSLYGIAGRVLDNRRHAVYLGEPAPEEQAREVLKELHQRFGVQGTLVSSLSKRPHGLLEIVDGSGAVLAVAQDLASVSSPDGGPFLVKDVEFGVGYSWHGRQDRTYRGDLELVVDKAGGIAVVNAVPMEDYIRGIVASEIFAKAPAEALKAQAVTARGEVLAKLGTRHLTDPYLLCAEQHCQVYTGLSGETAATDAAVAATRGELLFVPGGGRLVDSVYSAVCGGHTENNESVWGGLPNSVLRGRADLVSGSVDGPLTDASLPGFLEGKAQAYCAANSFANPKKYRWERRFSQSEVDEIAQPLKVGRVRVLSVARRGVSGRAEVLTVGGEDGATQVRGELNIRRLFKNLNSAMFLVEPPDKAHPGVWVFKGGGWGHGVGMCQLGAIGRAERGQSYRDILRHYFGGAEVVKVYR